MDPEVLELNLPKVKGYPIYDVEAIRDAIYAQLPPLRHDNKVQVVLSPMSRDQLEIIQDLNARVDEIKAGGVDPHDDNMLKVTTDGRKNNLDARLVRPNAPENPEGKINKAAENIHRIWKRDAKAPTTQLVFLDLATPKAKAKAKAKPLIAWTMSFEKFAKRLKLDLDAPGVRAQAMNVYGREVLEGIAAGEDVAEDVLVSLDQPWQGLARGGLRRSRGRGAPMSAPAGPRMTAPSGPTMSAPLGPR